MNRKLLAIPVLVMFLLVMVAPISADGEETNGDIVIKPIGQINLSPGSSENIDVTMFNTSTTDNYMFELKDYSDNGIHITCSYIGSPEVKASDNKTFSAQISCDKYTRKGDYSCSITISLIKIGTEVKETINLPVTVSISSLYSGESFNKILGLFTIPGIDTPELNAAITFIIWIIITAIVIFLYNTIISRIFGEDVNNKFAKKNISIIWALAIMIYGTYNTLLVYGANERLLDLMWAIMEFVYIIIISFIIWNIYKAIVYRFFHKMEKNDGFEGVDTSLIPLFNTIGKVVIGGVATAVFLLALGVNVAGIITGAGIVGLAISLGAQNMLTQLFGGMTLMVTRPFIKDDMIRIGDSDTVYEVVNIGLLNTELKEWGNTPHIIVPNSVVSSSKITNMTTIPDAYRIYLYIGVDYGSDSEKVREIMTRAATEHPHIVKDEMYGAPTVRLESFDDSCITYRLSAYVDSFDDSTTYMGEMREMIVKEFNAAGINIPYAVYDVNIKDQ